MLLIKRVVFGLGLWLGLESQLVLGLVLGKWLAIETGLGFWTGLLKGLGIAHE